MQNSDTSGHLFTRFHCGRDIRAAIRTRLSIVRDAGMAIRTINHRNHSAEILPLKVAYIPSGPLPATDGIEPSKTGRSVDTGAGLGAVETGAVDTGDSTGRTAEDDAPIADAEIPPEHPEHF